MCRVPLGSAPDLEMLHTLSAIEEMDGAGAPVPDPRPLPCGPIKLTRDPGTPAN